MNRYEYYSSSVSMPGNFRIISLGALKLSSAEHSAVVIDLVTIDAN